MAQSNNRNLPPPGRPGGPGGGGGGSSGIKVSGSTPAKTPDVTPVTPKDYFRAHPPTHITA